MTNWKPGMKAVCIEAKAVPYQSLSVGRTYTVQGVHTCHHGMTNLNVGATSFNPKWSGYTKCDCGCLVFGKWHSADRFRPLLSHEQEQLDAIEEEVLTEELVEA